MRRKKKEKEKKEKNKSKKSIESELVFQGKDIMFGHVGWYLMNCLASCPRRLNSVSES
jgi:hypothetical protein